MVYKSKHSVQERGDISFDFETAGARLEAGQSFRLGITAPQKRVIISLLTGFGICGLLQPALLCAAFAWGLFTAFGALITWRTLLISAGMLRRARFSVRPVHRIPDEELPVYSILVAAYDEAPLMPQLAAALARLDWPPDRLEILILIEAHDGLTRTAAEATRFPVRTRLLTVPPGGPLPKPNALNHGFAQARGDYVVIYDVEDLPAPDQLRRAHAAFVSAPEDLICLQARLQADNPKASWLAAQWALEYDLQFGLLLPGTALCRAPLLLGGTSNHFRRKALIALGGWDAYNVTEDADLGMRIARAGLRADTFASTTLEDAPAHWRVWLPQRGRWIKGYIQTWLVLMRTPSRTLQEMGSLRILAMQCALGGAILAPLSHAVLILLVLAASLSSDMAIGAAGRSLLMAGYAISLIGDLAAPGAWSWQRALAAITKPLYWPLLSIAAVHAVWDLAIRPHFLAKTPHSPRNAEPDQTCSTGSSASA